MPYALIPDGFTLKKVNKGELDAVNAKRKHDNVTTVLSNQTAVKVLGAGAGALALGGLGAVFIPLLESKIGTLTDDFKDAIGEVFDFLNPLPEIGEFLSDLNPLKRDPDAPSPIAESLVKFQTLVDTNKARREQGLTPYGSYEEYARAEIPGYAGI
jgi:hypothetical protein